MATENEGPRETTRGPSLVPAQPDGRWVYLLKPLLALGATVTHFLFFLDLCFFLPILIIPIFVLVPLFILIPLLILIPILVFLVPLLLFPALFLAFFFLIVSDDESRLLDV